MTNIEHATLRNGEALQGLAAASGLELRRVVELAAKDNLAEAVELAVARRIATVNRRRQFDVLTKRRPAT